MVILIDKHSTLEVSMWRKVLHLTWSSMSHKWISWNMWSVIANPNMRIRSGRVDVTIFGIIIYCMLFNRNRVMHVFMLLPGIYSHSYWQWLTSTVPLVIPNITTQHYNFTMEGDPSSCDVYAFQIIAFNDAEANDPSEITTRSLPSLP